MDAELQTYLGSKLTNGDAPANVSIVVGAEEAGVRVKHQLYVQAKLVLISASADRIHRAIVRNLNDLATPAPVGTLALRASIVIAADGRAVLVDRRLGYDLWNLDRRLRRQGSRVIDSALVNIDAATGTAMLSCPAQLLDDETRSALSVDSSDGLDDLCGGSLPISRVVFVGDAAIDDLAESLAEAAPMAQQADYTLRVADVEALLVLLRHVESRSVLPDDPDGLLAAISLTAR